MGRPCAQTGCKCRIPCTPRASLMGPVPARPGLAASMRLSDVTRASRDERVEGVQPETGLRGSRNIPEIVSLLEQAYRSPRHGNLDDPLDELIYIKLSQQTNSAKFSPVYRELRRRFTPWEKLLAIDGAELADILRPLGFHRQRAKQIQATLRKIQADRGVVGLRSLKDAPIDVSLAYLQNLPGIGVKTAYCVAMYSLGADLLPVDTHVERVSLRLGLIPEHVALRSRQGANREIHSLLEDVIPAASRYSFHVN